MSTTPTFGTTEWWCLNGREKTVCISVIKIERLLIHASTLDNEKAGRGKSRDTDWVRRDKLEIQRSLGQLVSAGEGESFSRPKSDGTGLGVILRDFGLVSRSPLAGCELCIGLQRSTSNSRGNPFLRTKDRTIPRSCSASRTSSAAAERSCWSDPASACTCSLSQPRIAKPLTCLMI
jgi:hypothetical protein